MTLFPDSCVTLCEVMSQLCYVYIDALVQNEYGNKRTRAVMFSVAHFV